MSNITSSQYWTEVEALANMIAVNAMQSCDNDRSDAEDLINDSLLHETVDSHEWIIYYAYNLDVIQHSDNEDYYIDEFGIENAGEELKNRGLSGLHAAIAFWCLYEDVQGMVSDELDKLEEAIEDQEDEESED